WGVYDLDWLTYVLGDRFRPAKVLATLGRFLNDVETTYSVKILCDDSLTIDWQRRGGEHGPTKELIELRGSDGGLDVAMIPNSNAPVYYRFDSVTNSLSSTPIKTPWIREWKEAMAFPIEDLAGAIIEDRPPITPPARSLP